MPRLTVLDLRGDRSDPTGRLPRRTIDFDAVRDGVRETLTAVRRGGDSAVCDLTHRFDAVRLTPDELEVPRHVLDGALESLDGAVREALMAAMEPIRAFHEHARPSDWDADRDGTRFGQRFRAVDRVGVYVPGGIAAYPSTVLMTVVPARVAGVREIVLSTPPTGEGGWPNRTILAAAALLGVDRVFRVGGAQAIAALAYGTTTVPACDKVVGPGNVYVAAAKQVVQSEGRCGIDAVAGPTEIAILADATADPRVVAADLVAQAEHDELATCVLVSPDAALVGRVEEALDAEIPATAHRGRVEAALAGQGHAVLVDDVAHGLEVCDAFAPEHLEIQTADAGDVAERVRFAGAVFVGHETPVSLGDYAAGPNHTLPTSGAARFTGGLSTADFLVPVNVVRCEAEALRGLAPIVRSLAAAEGLPAHARAVEIRLDDGDVGHG